MQIGKSIAFVSPSLTNWSSPMFKNSPLEQPPAWAKLKCSVSLPSLSTLIRMVTVSPRHRDRPGESLHALDVQVGEGRRVQPCRKRDDDGTRQDDGRCETLELLGVMRPSHRRPSRIMLGQWRAALNGHIAQTCPLRLRNRRPGRGLIRFHINGLSRLFVSSGL
jgi:hypothetical protein